MKTKLPALVAAFVATLLLALACYHPIYSPNISAAYKGGSSPSSKAILSFAFSTPAAAGVVSEASHAIAVTVPFGTNVTALKPTIVQTGASVSPASGATQDFTNPVDYTVTAVDSSTQSYTVTVTVASISAKDITSFEFLSSNNGTALSIDCPGSIVGTNISVTVPYATIVTGLRPTIFISGTGVSPASGATQDFTSPVQYTVTAADSSTKVYTITVAKAAASMNADLNSLTVDSGTLGPTFIASTTSYSVSVPYSVTSINVTAIKADAFANVNILPAQPSSLTVGANPVTVTVTAQSGAIKNYTVTVTRAANPAKAITAFNFTTPTATGVVTEATHTIALTVPFGTNVTALVPTITITGASVSPASGVAHDFTNAAVYTVTAADASTQDYTVCVYVSGNPFRVSAPVYGGNIWSTTDGGSTWASGGSTNTWAQQFAGSADGTKLIASGYVWNTWTSLYRSTDSGQTWNALASAGSHAFYGLASSDDGSILGVMLYDTVGNFYYSKDSGSSWLTTPITISGNYWSSLVCSADGKKWVIENGGDGAGNVKVILGTFDGASTWTWTATPYTAGGGSDYPNGFSISKDGVKILVSFAAHAHTSPDFGATWSAFPSYPGTPMTASAMSGDGSKLAVVVNHSYLYTSSNGGSSWQLATGLPVLNPATDNYYSPSISFDGSRLAIYSYVAASSGGYIYLSNDGGASFTQQTGPGASGLAYWSNIFIQPK